MLSLNKLMENSYNFSLEQYIELYTQANDSEKETLEVEFKRYINKDYSKYLKELDSLFGISYPYVLTQEYLDWAFYSCSFISNHDDRCDFLYLVFGYDENDLSQLNIPYDSLIKYNLIDPISETCSRLFINMSDPKGLELYVTHIKQNTSISGFNRKFKPNKENLLVWIDKIKELNRLLTDYTEQKVRITLDIRYVLTQEEFDLVSKLFDLKWLEFKIDFIARDSVVNINHIESFIALQEFITGN